MTPRTQGARVRPRSEEITIERDGCETNFTIMPNEIADDQLLSWQAKGMLYYIVSRPPNWKVVAEQLKSVGRCSLPAVRKILAEIIKAGYGKRQIIFGDGHRIKTTKTTFSNRPKWRKVTEPARQVPPDSAPEVTAESSVSRFFDHRKDRASETEHPVLSNDRYKPDPPSPPSSDARPPGTESRTPEPNLEANSKPPSSEAVPSANGLPRESAAIKPLPAAPTGIADAATNTAAPPATGEREKASAKSAPDDEPATLERVKFHYELKNRRNLSKADDRWKVLTLEEQAAALARMSQYFKSCADRNARPVELWVYLGDRVFKHFAPAKDVPQPKATPRADLVTEDQVWGSPMSERAAREGWVSELVEYVRANRKWPVSIDCAGFPRKAAERRRKWETDALLAKYAPGFRERDERLTRKAFEALKLPVPHPLWPEPEPEMIEENDFNELSMT